MIRSIITKFLFLFYKYYDKGSTKSIAYESALMALILVLFLNVFAVLVYLGIIDRYPLPEERWKKYLVNAIILTPFFFLFKILFKKEDILKVEMDKSTMRKGYFLAISYIICSFLILTWVINNK